MLRATRRSFALRCAAVALLTLATPAVLDVVVDTASWLTGAECCSDGCDDTDAPCSQQCVHCTCGARPVAMPANLVVRDADAQPRTPFTPLHLGAAAPGVTDPPFRPPAA
ncbi:MAG: hypothetical protein U0228_08120 [Myxococcaceae bacterium]